MYEGIGDWEKYIVGSMEKEVEGSFVVINGYLLIE